MATPTLGYGRQSEATIDQVNIWMRSTPWYQQQLRAWGQDPGHPTLTKPQSQQILRMAQQNGVVVDEGHMEVDDHGNFNPIGHKLRNTMIVAGIVGAAIAAPYVIPYLTGAGGAGTTLGMSAALPGALATVPALTATGVGAGVGSGLVYGGTAANVIGGVTPPAAHAGIFASSPMLAPTLVGTLGNVFANVYAANKQTSANDRAAALSKQAADEALAFQKAQADRDFATAEANRHANYDQWAAGQRRLGTLGDLLGLGPREIPGYVPLPGSSAASGASGAAASSALPTIDPQGDLSAQIAAYFKARGVSDQETPYWVGEWPELVARGQELGNPQYAAQRLSQADIFGGARAPATTTAAAPRATYTPPTGSIGSMLPLPMTPALPFPTTPYAPGTLASYFSGY